MLDKQCLTWLDGTGTWVFGHVCACWRGSWPESACACACGRVGGEGQSRYAWRHEAVVKLIKAFAYSSLLKRCCQACRLRNCPDHWRQYNFSECTSWGNKKCEKKKPSRQSCSVYYLGTIYTFTYKRVFIVFMPVLRIWCLKICVMPRISPLMSFIWIKALFRNAALPCLFFILFQSNFSKVYLECAQHFLKSKKVKTLMLKLLGALICSFLRITVNRAVRGPK